MWPAKSASEKKCWQLHFGMWTLFLVAGHCHSKDARPCAAQIRQSNNRINYWIRPDEACNNARPPPSRPPATSIFTAEMKILHICPIATFNIYHHSLIRLFFFNFTGLKRIFGDFFSRFLIDFPTIFYHFHISKWSFFKISNYFKPI